MKLIVFSFLIWSSVSAYADPVTCRPQAPASGATTAGKAVHSEFIMFNGRRYGADSALFDDIYEVVEKLIAYPMIFQNGVELSSDYQSLIQWANGKSGPKTPYDDIANCPALNQKRTCRVLGYGILHFP